MTELTASAKVASILDDRIRGAPPGTSAFPALEVAARGRRSTEGGEGKPARRHWARTRRKTTLLGRQPV
jgi:hypothetical protein